MAPTVVLEDDTFPTHSGSHGEDHKMRIITIFWYRLGMRNRLDSTSSMGARVAGLAAITLLATSCSSASDDAVPVSDLPRIVVSHAVLGAVTSEIVGTSAEVVVLVPNGVDPHVFEPSAKDIETLNSADLVVVNGLGLESRLEDIVGDLRARQIPIFEATDHISAHETPKPDEPKDVHADEHAGGHDDHADESAGDHADHLHSEGDPHFWTDPRLMADVVEELGDVIRDLGLDIGDRALMFSERLLTFDQDMLARTETLAVERRVLVTGHESLGYFAERYGFDIIGTIIPGLSTSAEVSAGNLAAVKKAVEESGVDVIFTELGTPSASARVLSDELGVDVVEISTHLIPEDESGSAVAGDAYIAFIEFLVETIVSALEI